MLNEFSPHENDFQQWIDDGYPGAKQETLDYLRHLSDPEDYTQPPGRDAVGTPVGSVSPGGLCPRNKAG